jgi:hypothetical protein
MYVQIWIAKLQLKNLGVLKFLTEIMCLPVHRNLGYFINTGAM